MTMRLKVILPTNILMDEEVGKIVAEAQNGSFGILPKHIDFVAALVPGVLAFVDAEGVEKFLGIDEGILVKCADEVRVSTRNAVRGDDLGSLSTIVRKKFLEIDEHEKSARTALARLEAGVVRRFIELKDQA